MNQTKIYVGNLAWSTNENDLRTHFSGYGEIKDINLVTDRETGKSRGFAFITFSSNEEGSAALAENGRELGGRKLKINTAKESQRKRRGEF